ncbi:MAG: hypothetical protein ACRDNK_16130 [Solirubrobacteraceae bacterium]
MPHRILKYARANAIATLAFVCSVLALAGSSYAAINIPDGSVGTRQLRNGAVTSRKLAKHAVTAATLDPKSIAGHIADWVQIRADGHVTASRPKASVSMRDPTRGLFQVSWNRSIPSGCIAIANPTNVPTVLGSASASVLGLGGQNIAHSLLVSTFDASGNNVPENVNVVVICP